MFKNNKAIPAQHAAKPSIWVWLQQMQEKVTASSEEATAIPQCWCTGSRLWFLHINVKASHWGRTLPRCNSLIKPQNRKVTAKVSLGEGRQKSISSWYNILPGMPNFQQKELGDKERNRKEVTICRKTKQAPKPQGHSRVELGQDFKAWKPSTRKEKRIRGAFPNPLLSKDNGKTSIDSKSMFSQE